MLPLVSERFERAICRALFVAICLLPTAGVAGWTGYQRLAGHRAACEQTLVDCLGLAAKLAAVEPTRPGGWRLAGVELRDPETDRLLAKAATIDASLHGQDLWLTLSQAEFDLEGFRELTAVVERRLRLAGRFAPGRVYLSADEALLTDRDRHWQVMQLLGTLVPESESAAAQLSFRWANSAARRPVTCMLVRVRDGGEPRTRLELDTGEAPFPLALAAPWIDACDWLGSDSLLVGRAAVEIQGRSIGWGVDGRFDRVDLGRLVAGHFGHHLAGEGQIELQASGHDGQLHRAAGSLRGGSGVIGRSLLSALQRELAMAAASPPAAVGDRLRYDELRLAFVLDGQGRLTLRGELPYARGAVLVDRNGMLLAAPAMPQHSGGLVRALAAPGGGYELRGPSPAASLARLDALLPRGVPEMVRKKNEPRASSNSPP